MQSDLTEAAELLLRSYLDERQKWTSGKAIVSGTRHEELEGVAVADGPVVGLYAFSALNGELRYDNEEPQRMRYVRGGQGKPLNRATIESMEPIEFRRRLRFTRNAEYSASWTLDGPTTRSNLIIAKPGDDIGGTVARDHHLYDILAAGILDHGAFVEGTVVSTLVNRLLELKVVGLTEQAGITQLKMQGEHLQVECDFQREQGVRPVRFHVSSPADPASSTTTTRWERQNGVDVPVSMIVDRDVPQIEHRIVYELTFDWSLVNEPIPPEMFDYRSFTDIPGDLGVEVVDRRSGVAALVGEWRPGGMVVAPAANESGVMPAPATLPPASGRLWWIIGLNMLVVAIGLVIWFCKHRSRGTT